MFLDHLHEILQLVSHVKDAENLAVCCRLIIHALLIDKFYSSVKFSFILFLKALYIVRLNNTKKTKLLDPL